jgi:hypothetical protein
VEQSIRSTDLIGQILQHACHRGEIVILATPYLRFETTFVRLEVDKVHCHANMDLEDARFGLRSPDLKLRFPHGHHFYEGATSLLGLGRAGGRPSLQLALPATLEDGDSRRAYRVDRVGRVPVTLSTRKFNLRTGRLVNLSTTGVRMFMNHVEPDDLEVGDVVQVDFALNDLIQINALVKVRHLSDRTFGAEFRPALDGGLLDNLASWVFQRREEAALALTLADARSAQAQAATIAGGRPWAELVLVSGSVPLEERLAGLLAGQLPPLRRVAPTIQAVRDLGPARPALVLLHLDSPGWEAKKRLKTLAECLPRTQPFVLLGTGVEAGPLLELGGECNAVWTYALPESPSSIFPRLLQGILRKQG